MQRYVKFIVQVVMAAVLAIIAALQDDRLDTTEWINVALAVASAVGVIAAGESPGGAWRYAKTIVSGVIAALMALQSFLIDGGLSTSELLQVAVAFVAALGLIPLKGPIVQPAGLAAGRNIYH